MNQDLRQDLEASWQRVVHRRSFLKGIGIAGAAVPVAAVPATAFPRAAAASTRELPRGDADILRFLAAAEIIESDLWQQYAELGGASGGNAAYVLALQNLDSDMPQYISDNTDDEMSHAAFLNAYLESRGAEGVSLERFRTLPSTAATGALQVRRLTNLQKLDVDTSWYVRYRATTNPDLGATFPQAVTIRDQPAIPVSDTDTPPGQQQPDSPAGTPAQLRMQAIANTAGFHFAFIEQGGSSLYTTLALQVSDPEVLRIVISIGGVEVDHFGLWHDKAGNAVSQPLAGVVDPETHTTFPDLNALNSELAQTNLILPEPCQFLNADLPACSVIRPSSPPLSGAMAAVRALTADQLFLGQSPAFFETLADLARAADGARRHL